MIAKRIAVILYDGSDLLDFSGPTTVFHGAARHLVWMGAASTPPYAVDFLSEPGGLIRTFQGLRVETRPLPELAPGQYDTLIISGGVTDDLQFEPGLVQWLRRNHVHARRVASVCTGAFLLARAGLLDGRRAATHWQDCTTLQRRFPRVEVDPESIFVQDGSIWTSAGITAGVDMALAMIEEDHGHELAMMVARWLVVFLKRPGGQSQFSTVLQSQSADGPLAPLLKWIIEHPGADLRAEALADRANMSLRNFYRAFEQATGTSPAEWVEAARTEIAKRMLEQTAQPIDQVALKSGFVGYERLRRTFARRIGVTPAEYRARFARPGALETSEVDLSTLVAGLAA